MRNYKELEVWKDSRMFVKATYILTANLPEEERFGLKSQILRCVVSIPSNIAEGSANGKRFRPISADKSRLQL